MTGQSKYTPEAIHEWRLRAKSLRLKRRLSTNQICCQIGNEFGVSDGTIWYHLSGQGRKFDDKNYGQKYDLAYKHLIRRFNSTLPQLFNGNPELSLSELTGRIKEQIGISMRESTLEKLLGKYEGTERGPPVVKTESGGYKLNNSYYEPTL